MALYRIRDELRRENVLRVVSGRSFLNYTFCQVKAFGFYKIRAALFRPNVLRIEQNVARWYDSRRFGSYVLRVLLEAKSFAGV